MKTRTRRKIPYVQQMQGSDCAAACLTMVLGHLGRDVTLDEARDAVGAGRGGASAYDLVIGAERFGARGRGVQLDVGDLKLPAPRRDSSLGVSTTSWFSIAWSGGRSRRRPGHRTAPHSDAAL